MSEKKLYGMNKVFMSLVIFFFVGTSFAVTQGKPLVLQEMSWSDVRDYLKTCNMVIIPLGSTEQHGPHLPLGTDYYEAFGMSKMISAQTDVVVAPVLLSGYSEYHSGFPGTLSLTPETMERILFETAEMLMKYGFRRFMFFNYHGGNRVVENKVIHRINHTTEATAVAIGYRASFQPKAEKIEGVISDEHAGIGETSIMLYLRPELVRMEKAEKPKLHMTARMRELYLRSQEDPELLVVYDSIRAVPEEAGKGGAGHEMSSNGIWSTGDPKASTRDRGERSVRRMVDSAVKFIQAWKKVSQ